jgi:Protein of unknown function (DUF3306)
MRSKSVQAARFSLRRWSQRKLEAARAQAQAPPPPMDAPAVAQPPGVTAHAAPESTGSSSVSTLSANADLPAIEALTIDSDFAPFFKPQVDASIKRAALKQLFRDPRFNVMDGLDTYIDDYTQADPIPSAMLEDLMQRRIFFSPSAETDPGERVIDEPVGDHAASSAEAIAPPVAQVAPGASPAPMVPADPLLPVTPDVELESGVDAKADKP